MLAPFADPGSSIRVLLCHFPPARTAGRFNRFCLFVFSEGREKSRHVSLWAPIAHVCHSTLILCGLNPNLIPWTPGSS